MTLPFTKLYCCWQTMWVFPEKSLTILTIFYPYVFVFGLIMYSVIISVSFSVCSCMLCSFLLFQTLEFFLWPWACFHLPTTSAWEGGKQHVKDNGGNKCCSREEERKLKLYKPFTAGVVLLLLPGSHCSTHTSWKKKKNPSGSEETQKWARDQKTWRIQQRQLPLAVGVRTAGQTRRRHGDKPGFFNCQSNVKPLSAAKGQY